MKYTEIKGDLIKLAKEGKFDVIAHGCNCFCTMGAGIAPQIAKAFGANAFPLEGNHYKGDINKLGQIDSYSVPIPSSTFFIKLVNAYTQYNYGKNHTDGTSKPLDYEALTLCMRKINHKFKGQHIGLPKIGCGLAGGNWEAVKSIIQSELVDCKVTIVIYKK